MCVVSQTSFGTETRSCDDDESFTSTLTPKSAPAGSQKSSSSSKEPRHANTVVSTPVGSTLTITAVRDKKRQDFKVVVGDLAQIFPDRFGGGDSAQSRPGEASATSFGMNIKNLNEQMRQSMGLREKGGVLVDSVEPNSFAEDLGLQKGDVLVSINQQPVNNTDDVMRIRGTLKAGSPVAIRVMRQQGRNGTWASTYLGGTLPN